MKHLGEFEQLLLLAIRRLGRDAYGIAIQRLIAAKAKRRTSIGALYLSLDRMKKKGFTTHRMGKPAKVQGGRAKRFIALSTKGNKVLDGSLKRIDSLRLP